MNEKSDIDTDYEIYMSVKKIFISKHQNCQLSLSVRNIFCTLIIEYVKKIINTQISAENISVNFKYQQETLHSQAQM